MAKADARQDAGSQAAALRSENCSSFSCLIFGVHSSCISLLFTTKKQPSRCKRTITTRTISGTGTALMRREDGQFAHPWASISAIANFARRGREWWDGDAAKQSPAAVCGAGRNFARLGFQPSPILQAEASERKKRSHHPYGAPLYVRRETEIEKNALPASGESPDAKEPRQPGGWGAGCRGDRRSAGDGGPGDTATTSEIARPRLREHETRINVW